MSTKQSRMLVRPMFEGPVDVIGDVHGEIDALESLLRNLGYTRSGTHPEHRRLVFLGDLVDRGPDTPAVLDLVMPMCANGRAQCVLGNHELNLLRGKLEFYNYWFHGDMPEEPESPQAILPSDRRNEVLKFIRSMPVALERTDLRAVHACWEDAAVNVLRTKDDALDHFQSSHQLLKSRVEKEQVTDKIERELILQNENPVKLITNGPERRAPAPFEAGGKIRNEARHPWWNEYNANVFCVCGHYWRVPMPGKPTDCLFNGNPTHRTLGNGNVMCIDFSVGGRYLERKTGKPFGARLAALRWPDRQLMQDDGLQDFLA